MTDEHFQMIELYLESERIRHYHQLELFSQEVLEDFFCYQVKRKGEDFEIAKLSDQEKKDYYCHLLENQTANTIVFARGKMRIIESFLSFLSRVGLISPQKGGAE